MGPQTYISADEAWRGVLRDLVKGGFEVDGVTDSLSVGSDFGGSARPTRELIGASFTIADPRRRLIESAVRPVDLRYAIANVVWTFTGAADLDAIAHYNPRGYAFSDDGETLAGAAGPRLFGAKGAGAGNPFSRAVERIRRDPATRRAVLPLFWPKDLFAETRDIPCTSDIQLLLRGGRLHCVVHMRSQSALGVLPYDLFLFTMLHEAAAATLGVPIGPYTHLCSSLHFYEDERQRVESVLAETGGAGASPMGQMPPLTDVVREQLAEAERAIRLPNPTPTEGSMWSDRSQLGPYWDDLLSVMETRARRPMGGSTRSMSASSLRPS